MYFVTWATPMHYVDGKGCHNNRLGISGPGGPFMFNIIGVPRPLSYVVISAPLDHLCQHKTGPVHKNING